MVGNPKAIDEAIAVLQKNGLVLKAVKGLQDYLSYEQRVRAHLIESLEKKFVEQVNTRQAKILIVSLLGDNKNFCEDQKVLHSGVSFLLYLIKHSRPDIAKIQNNGKNSTARCEFLCVITFVLNTKIFV